jgi:3-phenylpropionate/cinnamic acid dioxygenase small subunit
MDRAGEAMMTDRAQDAESISGLLSRYGRMLDARDYAGWAALFAPDGEWVGGEAYGTIRGRTDLLAFATREFADTPPCVHIFGNMAVETQGDTANVWSRWMLVEQHTEGLRIALAGSYADRLVRLPEGWRFARREVTLDLPVVP